MTFRLLISLATALSLSLPAWAEDFALILSNVNYRSQPDLPSGQGVDRIGRALERAGFSVVTLENMSAASAAGRLASVRDRMEDVDRLVVIVNGHVATSHGQAWLLEHSAARPAEFTIGGMGLPVAPFMAAAAEHPGAAIVAVIDQKRLPRVGAGVTPGFIPGDVAQGVTVLTGEIAPMAALFEGGLLEGGQPMAEALTGHRGVQAAGFVPALGSFMPAPAAEAAGDEVIGEVVAEPEAEPEPTPEERMMAVERSLGLSRDDRRRVQRNLAILGFDPRGIDGLIGPGSRRAIRGYQADRGYPATGYLTAPLLEQLFDEGARRSAELEEEARRRQAEAEARDTTYWRDTGQGGDEAGLRAYLRRYPDGLFADVAKVRLQAIEDARRPQVSRAEQRFWARTRELDTREAYEDYLVNYPKGAYAGDARARIEEIDQEEARAENDRLYQAEEKQVAGNKVARRLVENRLAALGLEPGPVDGEFDEDTRRALRRYQEARGLKVTGYVNQATMVRILIGN